jgi:hypothetical protein
MPDPEPMAQVEVKGLSFEPGLMNLNGWVALDDHDLERSIKLQCSYKVLFKKV